MSAADGTAEPAIGDAEEAAKAEQLASISAKVSFGISGHALFIVQLGSRISHIRGVQVESEFKKAKLRSERFGVEYEEPKLVMYIPRDLFFLALRESV